jgi:MFS family permease
MLAVGPALAGLLWVAFGRPAFFLNCGFYLVALALYAYGVAEVPRDRQRDLDASSDAAPATLARYLRIVRNRKVLLFAPTWLAINAILGLWAQQGTLLITGNMQDSSQFLMRGISPSAIGLGEAALAVVFGAGILFWGTVYARFRRTTLLLLGTGAFVAMTIDILAVNHLGGSSVVLLVALGLVAVVALFVMSGATPAALGLLADVSEGFEEDRSALMGLYSVFLGLGQVIGAVIGGIAASWKGIDGLVVATVGLLAVGIAALLNLRGRESMMLDGPTAGLQTALGVEALRDPIPTPTANRRKPQAAAKEDR